jgi:hypothetical protein
MNSPGGCQEVRILGSHDELSILELVFLNELLQVLLLADH